MDATTIILGIGFPLLLFFVAVGAGTAFSMTSSDSVGFLVAKACFSTAAFDVVAMAVYWAVAIQRKASWSVAIPTVAALIAVPSLVLVLQWLGNMEVQLSTRLFPGNTTTPHIVGIPENALKVFHGTNVSWTTKMPLTILRMAGEKMIEIYRDAAHDELIISTLKIFDDRNNIIARSDADDGLWVENSTRKKRPDKSTLIVYDHTDKEVLRLVFLNSSAISITGISVMSMLQSPLL
jgi:hypothetical protein